MSLERSGTNYKRLNELDQGLEAMKFSEQESLAYQKILDWLKSDHNEIDLAITDSAELIAEFSCKDCNGGGWYEYEDHDDYKDFTITEICECVIRQVDV
tara:strand:- start:810 stop:1106 length:297 start_codon:yes stop_codon:yes gene_type:complete